MKTLSEIIPVVGATQRDVDNWTARLDLSTHFEATTRGSARVFSRANTLELAFIAAFIRGGAKAADAAMYTRNLLKQVRYGGLREWFVFPAGDLSKAVSSDKPAIRELEEQLASTTLSFVHVSEIVRRVDSLFGGK